MQRNGSTTAQSNKQTQLSTHIFIAFLLLFVVVTFVCCCCCCRFCSQMSISLGGHSIGGFVRKWTVKSFGGNKFTVQKNGRNNNTNATTRTYKSRKRAHNTNIGCCCCCCCCSCWQYSAFCSVLFCSSVSLLLTRCCH